MRGGQQAFEGDSLKASSKEMKETTIGIGGIGNLTDGPQPSDGGQFEGKLEENHTNSYRNKRYR